jgi:hypothetical protein
MDQLECSGDLISGAITFVSEIHSGIAPQCIVALQAAWREQCTKEKAFLPICHFRREALSAILTSQKPTGVWPRIPMPPWKSRDQHLRESLASACLDLRVVLF